MNFAGEKGLFGDFERWDILIMLDVVLFLSNLLVIFIFNIGSVFPGEFLSGAGNKKKDYMEGYVDEKKLMLQVNSLAIANSVYLYLIYIDEFQRDMKIQWFILVSDWIFLIGIYRSSLFATLAGI